MEALIAVIGLILGLALIVAPIFAWVNFFRIGGTRKDIDQLRGQLASIRTDLTKLHKALQDHETALATVQPADDSIAAAVDRVEAQAERLTSTDESKPVAAEAEPIATIAPTPAPEEPEEIAAQVKAPETIAERFEKLAALRAHTEKVRSLPVVVPEELPVTPSPAEAPEVRESAEKEAERPTDIPEVAAEAGERADVEAEVKATGKIIAEPTKTPPADLSQPDLVSAPEVEPEEHDVTAPRRERKLSDTAIGRVVAAIGRSFGPKDAGKGDWETRVGRYWLNLIGIVVLVVGLVLLIQQTLLYLDATGKVALGFAVSIALTGSGLFLERRERYRIFGRTLIGGGWALLYFTAYAAHNVDVARIIENETVALLVLLAAAGLIIAHSFAYRSQFVTGLAYGLGFLALHLSPISFYSLIAVAVLAASILFVIRVTDWRIVGLLAVVATYGSHARWLWATEVARNLGTADTVLAGLAPQDAFWANIGLLSLYWVIFCATALVRPPVASQSRMIDLAVSALNMVGLLSLIGWQMVEHIPGNLHYLAIPALVAYTAVAVVDRQQKRPLLAQFNGSVAVVLFTIALPLALKPEDLSTDWLAPYWAAGSAFVWVIGNWLDRQLYRGEAYGIAALALAAALASNFQGRMTEHDPALWAAGLVAILLFEGYCEILRPGKSRETIGKKELLLGDVSLLAAVVLIAMAIWSVAEPYETGISWLVIGIVLIEAGGHHSRLRLRLQGYLLAAAAFIGFANFNIAAPEIGQLELSWRYTLAGAVLLYFASARLLYARWSLSDREGSLASLPAAVATVLFAGASYHALPSEIFPIAWVIWAVILLDTGGRLGQREIRWYAYGLGTAGFIASCQVNLIAATADGYLAGWGYALATAAGFYIMTARLLYAGWQLDKAEIQSAAAPSALATVLVAGAAYEALPSEVFPLVWAAWALLLLEIGGRISQLNIRLQAYLLGVAAFGCMIGFQLSDAASSAAIAGWLLALAGAGVLYLASQRLIFAGWQFVPIETQTNWVPAALATVIYAGAVWRALPTDLVSVGWIAWALILQQTGRRLKQGGIAMSGLALGVLALAAAIAINVYQVAGPADAVNLPNWAVLGLAIAALYAMHARAQGQVSMAPSDAFVSAKGFLHGATLLFALAVWRELPSIAVAVAWTALCVAAIELAERFERKALILQAQVLIVAAVVRLFMANFINPGEAFGLSHRLITVAPVIVTLYYLRALSVAGWASGPGEPKFISPSVYSWTAALLLVVLARFEVGREYAVAVWSPVFLALLALGLRIPDRDFRFQSYAIALLIFGRSWSTNLFLDGALFGLSERIVTVLPALAAIFAAVVIVPARGEHPVVALKGRLGRAFGYADLNARSGLAILFAFLLLILIFYEMSIDLVSVGWAAEALALFVLGFSLNERSFRFFGLGLLLVCLFKIVLLDLEGVETIYRILSFIVLGLVLLLVSFGYSRYRKVIERYI